MFFILLFIEEYSIVISGTVAYCACVIQVIYLLWKLGLYYYSPTQFQV